MSRSEKAKIALAACLLAAADPVSSAEPAAIVLASGHEAKAAIVTGAAPGPNIKAMSAELANYLKAMTGAEFKITEQPLPGLSAIRIGGGYTAAKPDECAFFVENGGLRLAGEGTRGPVYATYRFLESLGARFWTPTRETVPHVADLSVPAGLRVISAPAFEYRQAYGEPCSDPRWCAKLGLNGDLWAKAIPAQYGGSYQVDLSQSLANGLLNPKKYFAAHPDWYACREKDSKGAAVKPYRSKNQICTMNDAAMAQVLEEVRAMLRDKPGTPFVSVSLNDNDETCQCEKCKALADAEGGATALGLRAANFTAKALAKDYPRLKINFLAYWLTDTPPKTMRPEPNVCITFALLDRNHGLPVNKNGRHQELLRRWSDLSNGHVYIWDYYAMFRNFLTPMPNIDCMKPSFETYRRFKCKGVFAQLPWGSLGEFVDLRCWLMGKLAWDPGLDDKALINEWIDGTCGKGAPFVHQYWALLYGARDRANGAFVGAYDSNSKKWLTAGDISTARGLFSQALAATEGDAAAHAQIERLACSVLAETVLRYDGLALPLPPKAILIDELARLGEKHKCSTWREWDSFSAFIASLRPPAPAQPH